MGIPSKKRETARTFGGLALRDAAEREILEPGQNPEAPAASLDTPPNRVYLFCDWPTCLNRKNVACNVDTGAVYAVSRVSKDKPGWAKKGGDYDKNSDETFLGCADERSIVWFVRDSFEMDVSADILKPFSQKQIDNLVCGANALDTDMRPKSITGYRKFEIPCSQRGQACRVERNDFGDEAASYVPAFDFGVEVRTYRKAVFVKETDIAPAAKPQGPLPSCRCRKPPKRATLSKDGPKA
ncbi:MAG: hypothetical protein PHE27_05310 [Alphaproteobacteria bacterium]|nr:hypothetical protein [Alphaproteobacteria bacterium]